MGRSSLVGIPKLEPQGLFLRYKPYYHILPYNLPLGQCTFVIMNGQAEIHIMQLLCPSHSSTNVFSQMLIGPYVHYVCPFEDF